MINKSISDTIKNICTKLSIGLPQTMIPLSDTNSDVLQYKVTTSKSVYLIEVISKYNKEQINELKNKIRVGKEFESSINIISPISSQNDVLIKYKGKYCLVYDIKDLVIQQKKELTKFKIKNIANLLAKIHQTDIPSDIPSYYHKVEIDFDKLLKKLKKIKSDTYQLVYDNIFTLKDIVYKCNSSLQYVERNLALDIGDYEFNKILWKNEVPFIYDITSITFINPASSLCTTSFHYSLENNEINYDYYKTFIQEYIKEYGPLKVDFKDSLYVGIIHKLDVIQKLSLKLNQLSDKREVDFIKEITDELLIYYDNINKMNETYLSIIAKKDKK